MSRTKMSRRGVLSGAAASLALPSIASAQVPGYDSNGFPLTETAPEVLERRVSGFLARDWQNYFPDRSGGAILVDTVPRVLHYWSESGAIYNVYPVSVPLTPELTRTGRTRVVQKRVGPDWRPTPNMLKRNPDLPTYVGPGPQNPLGTHALYLSWRYYRIHGTNDERKIGRKSSNGCIGLYNEHIAELFEYARVGTQVLLI
ncbi:MAG: L,D-transpeptidase [Pseudomonadota bacterium]